MKIIAISGSSNDNGQTAMASKSLLKGAAEVGADTEFILLNSKKIKHCLQCGDEGWGKCSEEGRCIIKDNFYDIFNKIKEADAVIFATPVFLWEMSEVLWSFMTRMRRICWKFGKYDTVNKKPVIGIAIAGGGGTGAVRTLFQMEQILDFTGFELIDMFPIKRQNFQLKLSQLEMTGKWLVTTKINELHTEVEPNYIE